MLTTHLGTKPFMSPEFFKEDVEVFSTKIDVWALNTCLYMFITGKFYFFSVNPKEMQRLILNKEFIIGEEISFLTDETK